MTDTLPAVGTIGLTKIAGDVGKVIKVGQFLNGQGFKDWEHAFLLGPDGQILQAEPGGASIGNVSQYSDIYWCTNIAAQYSVPWLLDIWNGAQQYKNVGYSFLDYGALSLHRFHLNPPGLQKYIASTDHMICSQLVDQAYENKGAHLFANVWPGYVTPLGIYNLDRRIAITRSVHVGGDFRPLRRSRTVKM